MKLFPGYDSHVKDTTFTIGLQNIREQDVDMVLKTIDDTVDQVVYGKYSYYLGTYHFF